MPIIESTVFEEMLVAIDYAGRLVGDNMLGQADPVTFSPSDAHGVEEMDVLATSNGDQLGAGIVYMLLEGAAFIDGPHAIPIGGHGGELINAAHSAAAPTPLKDLGIRVKPGATYTMSFQGVGDTMNEWGCSGQIKWSSEGVRQPKQWFPSYQITAAVDANVQGENLLAVEATVPPGDSIEVGGVIKCAAGDMAALGINHIVYILSGGCYPRQEGICGGVGGELIVGAGHHVAPSQDIVSYHIKDNTAILVQFRGLIEAGVILGGISLGLVVT